MSKKVPQSAHIGSCRESFCFQKYLAWLSNTDCKLCEIPLTLCDNNCDDCLSRSLDLPLGSPI